MAAVLILLYLIAITPFRAGVVLHAGGGRESLGAAGVLVWGIRIQGRIGWTKGENGRRQLYLGKAAPTSNPAPGPGVGDILHWLRAVHTANQGRMLVKKAVSLDALEVDALVPGPDAAAAALLTGLAQVIGGLIPRLHVRARPAFSGSGALRVRCMISGRLGMLLAACALGTISYLKTRKKEEKSWIIPSEA